MEVNNMAIKIIDNCCSSEFLDYLKHVAVSAENWSLFYPPSCSIEDKFWKLNIFRYGENVHPFLAGLATALLIQIYEAGGRGLFIPEINFCGISIKDKHRPDNMHKDDAQKSDGRKLVKVLGIINSDWEEEWGGGFIHNETSNYIKPTSFCVFDPSELHSSEEIITDKKRFAIDFTVYRDQPLPNVSLRY